MPSLGANDIQIMEDINQKEIGQLLEKRRVRAMEASVNTTFKVMVQSVLKDISPYIALVLVIVFIVLLAKGVFRPVRRVRTNRRRQRAMRTRQSAWQRFTAGIRGWFSPLIKAVTPGYKTRMFLASLSPFATTPNGVPRTRIASGRCDNMRWLQMDSAGAPQLNRDGERGSCMSAVSPADIKWAIDVGKVPDFHDLPAHMQRSLRPRMHITIPYDQDNTVHSGNTFFVPRCDKAYYTNLRDRSGAHVPARLLEDMGTTCRLKSFPIPRDAYSRAGTTQQQLREKIQKMK